MTTVGLSLFAHLVALWFLMPTDTPGQFAAWLTVSWLAWLHFAVTYLLLTRKDKP